MRKIFLAAPLLAMAATVAMADPIEDREAIMKGFGKAMQSLAPIAKGEAPFDAAVVAAGLAAINEGAQKIDVVALFPPGSNTGESTAAPAIWENFDDFTARAEKLKSDAAAAAAANPADLDAFRAIFGGVAGNCGGCHEKYRIKKD